VGVSPIGKGAEGGGSITLPCLLPSAGRSLCKQAGKDHYRATNHLITGATDRMNLQAIDWSIENYHRAPKELCCVEECNICKEAGQRNHINCNRNCSFRAFIPLEAVQSNSRT